MVVVVVKSGCGAMESRPLFSVRISPDWSSPGAEIFSEQRNKQNYLSETTLVNCQLSGSVTTRSSCE